MDRFDRFDDDARRVLTYAQEEAVRFEHHYIGTEHILLGLVRVEGGVASRVLDDLGVDPEKIRTAVEFIVGRGGNMSLEVGLTPRAKRVIELAIDEARRLEHGYVGTEHLLLGLVREGEGIAAGVLESLGVDLAKVRVEVTRIVGTAPRGDPLGSSLRPMTFVHGPASIDDARRELVAAEAYSAVQAALLRRVVGIGGVAVDAGIVMELVALEIRATGGLLYWTARPDPARTLGEPEVAVGDDVGHGLRPAPRRRARQRSRDEGRDPRHAGASRRGHGAARRRRGLRVPPVAVAGGPGCRPLGLRRRAALVAPPENRRAGGAHYPPAPE